MPPCPYCKMAKELLERKNIPYTEKQIDLDQEAKDFFDQKGFRTVPQVFIDDEYLPEGFVGLMRHLSK